MSKSQKGGLLEALLGDKRTHSQQGGSVIRAPRAGARKTAKPVAKPKQQRGGQKLHAGCKATLQKGGDQVGGADSYAWHRARSV